jgi:hypothetical protein
LKVTKDASTDHRIYRGSSDGRINVRGRMPKHSQAKDGPCTCVTSLTPSQHVDISSITSATDMTQANTSKHYSHGRWCYAQHLYRWIGVIWNVIQRIRF